MPFRLGLEETDGGVWKLFAAVIVHGMAIVFCIGQCSSGTSVVEQWARYPEVAGSIPTKFQHFINFQISLASELTMIVNIDIDNIVL